MGIKPDGLIGHSVGELGCAYADGALTAEQVIYAAFARGKASKEIDLIKGMMAAVGKSQIHNILFHKERNLGRYVCRYQSYLPNPEV